MFRGVTPAPAAYVVKRHPVLSLLVGFPRLTLLLLRDQSDHLLHVIQTFGSANSCLTGRQCQYALALNVNGISGVNIP